MGCKKELLEAKQHLEKLEFALNESSIVVFTNRKGEIEYANDRFCQISKFTLEELIGSRHNIVNSGYHSREFFKNMWRTIGTGNVWRGQIRNRAKDGTVYWVDTTIIPFKNEDGKPYKYASIRHDITKLKEYEKQIKEMAYYDALTKLPNRNYLNDWIEHKAQQYKQDLTILFLDMNRLKFINDYYGHTIGDFVITQVARRLDEYVEAPDFVIRQGGDEFIIFILSTNCDSEILEIVEEVKKLFERPFYVKNYSIQLSSSIGIAQAPNDWYAYDTLKKVESTIKKADRAMYRAKKIKGNAHYFNKETYNEVEDYHREIEGKLNKALAKGEFRLVYQPIVNLKTDSVSGFEALLRWYNPLLGNVSPGEFIPLMEELGYIIEVGDWVIEEVCRQINKWQANNLNFGRIAINVSSLQFMNVNFYNNVKEALEKYNVLPQYIEFEVTERLLLDVDAALVTLEAFKQLGISISIDDFGTGYSSLGYINKIPINRLKIDQSFISNLDKESKIIIKTIITLGKLLNFQIVAEGIETKEQLHYLRSLNCEEGQGYYFLKPIEVEQIEKYLLDDQDK